MLILSDRFSGRIHSTELAPRKRSFHIIYGICPSCKNGFFLIRRRNPRNNPEKHFRCPCGGGYTLRSNCWYGGTIRGLNKQHVVDRLKANIKRRLMKFWPTPKKLRLSLDVK